MAKILIVEDDPKVVQPIRDWMEAQQHVLDIAPNGPNALEMLQAFAYELIILDWELPGLSGIDVLRKFRGAHGMTPVLMLTGKDRLEEKEEALDAGADDYLTKPFQLRELAARMRALLRRPPQLANHTIDLKGIVLDSVSRKITKDGVEISFQPCEMILLEFLMNHPNQPFSPQELLRRVWDSDSDLSLDAVYSCMKRVRRKIGDPDGKIIATVHGLGYRFET